MIMKRSLFLISTVVMMLAQPYGVEAQSQDAVEKRMDKASRKELRKEERQARKEQKRREKELADSVKAVIFGGDTKVNVGYGTTKKKNLTTAVSSVEVEDNAMSSYGDICEYLSGRVPGLVVTKAGGSYRFQIRGAMSIGAGSTEPLVLVDGAETTDISGLNPHDVKSVEVLKDAAASSIYGSRAACGVILITTKR